MGWSGGGLGAADCIVDGGAGVAGSGLCRQRGVPATT